MLVDELLSTPLTNRLKCSAVRWKPPSQDETPLQYFSSSKLLNRCVESCPSIPSLLIATILGPEALPGSARATRAKRSYTWEQDTAWFFRLKVKDKSEMDSLMNKEEYDKFAKESSS